MSRTAGAGTAAGLAVAPAVEALVDLLPQVCASLKRPGVPAELKAIFVAGALGPRHIPALSYLSSHGPMSVTDLGNRLGVTLPTASAMVAELSRMGLTERREDESDRRRTIVALDAAYRETVESWLTSRSAPIRQALKRLTSAERAAVVKGLGLLIDELGRAATSETGGPAASGRARTSGQEP